MDSKPLFDSTYSELFGAPPPKSINVGESSADIISRGRGFMGGFDLTMQVQVGCPGGCLYCYVPSGRMLTPREVKGTHGQDWGFVVRNKKDVPKKLKEHLEEGELVNKTIYWSGITDPYAAPGPVTKDIWQVFFDSPLELRPRRIAVQTRFRPERDADTIVKYSQSTFPLDGGPPVVVSYSIGTDRNELIRSWERATPLYEDRMRSIEALRKSGIFVVPTLSPFALWTDLGFTLELFKSWGIPYITCLFFKEKTKSANTPGHFLEYLQNKYPFLLNPAWQTERVGEMKKVYGQKRVLVGQDGFSSLASPHTVGMAI